MELTKRQKRLKVIEEWINNFPCKEFFESNVNCIHESINPESLLNFIEARIKNE